MKLYFSSFCGLLMLLLLSTSSMAMEISTSTNTKILNIGDEFIYTISIDKNLNDDVLDIRPLFKNFIIGNLTISHHSTNNTTWVIPLQPVAAGKIIIPELPIADAKTKSLIIDVIEKNESTANQQLQDTAKNLDDSASELQSPPILMETRLSTDSAYIGEMFSINIKIATNSNPEKKPLNIQSSNDFNLLPPSEPVNDKEIFADHYQDTLIYTYHLIPKKAGSLTLPFFSIPTKEVHTDKQIIGIKPIPNMFYNSKNNWLPSAGISIEEHWEPQTSYAKIGQPVTRTITITGINNTPEQLPELDIPTIPFVKIYADSKKFEQENQNGMLISRKIIQHIYIPEKNIAFTAPTINVDWWNTISNRVQHSTVDARKFIASIIEQQNNKPVIAAASTNTSHFELLKKQYLATLIVIVEISVPFLLILAFLAWYFRGEIQSRYNRYQLWKKVKHTCLHNESIATYQSILAWASLYYGSTFTAIEQLPFYFPLKMELDDLQENCFNQKSENWNGKKLLQKLATSSILKKNNG